MIEVVIWGLVQGLTEFLPVSSSGHLVLVPAFLQALGFDVSVPDLAVSAVLHLGTLLAVIVYYRRDLARLAHLGTDPEARRVLGLLALGTVPAVIGLPLANALDAFQDDPRRVAGAVLVTSAVLYIGTFLTVGSRRLEEGRIPDAVVVGVAQAMALVPGISRSGMTITAGIGRRFRREEAARYAFLLAIPTIAGGGLISLLDVAGTDADLSLLAVGMAVAALSGHAAIGIVLRALATVGFLPFAIYTTVVGILGLVVL
ncbi:MAG: undecaprenyl-diphosphate phosphatase [Acidimicrobiia bacterium]